MKVLDSHALLLYLEKGPGYEKVRDFLATASESGKPCLMSWANWGELFSEIYRNGGQENAEYVSGVIATLPIEFVDVDKDLSLLAGTYMATKDLSYAGCFSAALAKLKRAELITGDKEFKQLEGEIRISWI